MSGQAQQLQQMMAMFRVGEGEAQAAPAAAPARQPAKAARKAARKVREESHATGLGLDDAEFVRF
jgi:hypothetical protein